jgi:outer membrane lipopolysaccharide assembly protein LptE/RlpB
MQRLVVDIEDKYINLVVDLLSNLKQNIVKNITIQKEQNRNVSKLDTFRRLRDRSNNKTTLTMTIATNTNEMVNDGIF